MEEGHATWEESLGAYALGALPEDERQEMERHVQGCARCRQELAELQTAVDALPATVPRVRPPPELRARLMSIVESEAELLRAAGAGADRPRPRRRGPRSWFPRPVVAAGAAVGALAVGAAIGAVVFSEGSSGPGGRTISASGPAAAGAYLRVADDRARLVIHDMPSPPPGRVYQLWVRRSGGMPVPAGATFDLRSGEVVVPRPVHDGERVMVTTEPRGGSRVPTTMPVIVTRPA
jgi:anti-sigma-K factor RskA